MENSAAVFIPLLIGSAVFLLFATWLYALISALKNERLDSTMKLTWVLVVVLLNGLGAIIYLLAAPNRPLREERMAAEWHRRNRQVRHQLRPIPGRVKPEA